MKTNHIIAALAAIAMSAARADFTSVADLAANDTEYIAASALEKPTDKHPKQAAVLLKRIAVNSDTPEEVNSVLDRPDVQDVLAPAAEIVIKNPRMAHNRPYEGVARRWLQSTAGRAWAADNAELVARFLSNSPNQHHFLNNEFKMPEKFAAWKAGGFARPLGEVAKPESIAFIAAKIGDWDTITNMDRTSFTYEVFDYPLYSRWAKARSAGKSLEENYEFVQNELLTIGPAGTPASLEICQHLNALSTMMFNVMRQGKAIQEQP